MTNQPSIPAPHPDPHAPTAFSPPVGACDAHCHVFGPAALFPFSPTRTYTPPDAGIEEFEILRERLGLSRAVFVQASCHGTDNSAMVDALRRGEGRYAGVAMIDAATTEKEIEEMHLVGVRAIRFNFVAHLGGAPDMGLFWALVNRVQPWGWHVVLHFDARDLEQYSDTLSRMPCPYIIDHMARVSTPEGIDQRPFQTLLRLLDDDRAWVKISGAERVSGSGLPPYQDVVPFARALIDAAPERILWGTDWPHPNVRHMPDDGDLVDLVADFAPSETLRHRILVENPTTLYDFM